MEYENSVLAFAGLRGVLRAAAKWLFFAVFALGVAASASVSARAQSKGRTVTVEAVTLKPTTVVESVFSVGNFVANESVTIRPEVDGRIVQIAFDEGQPVKPGALLFRLGDATYQAQLKEAEARLKQSKRSYERAKALNKKGFSSGEILDKALSQMQIDEADVELNKAKLDKMSIVAPFAGTIGLPR